ERAPARPPPRGSGRDRQEHDGRRVRRPSRGRRLRRALPDLGHDGGRPRPAGLHVPERACRRHRGDRRHARPRGPRRRAAVGPARAGRRARADHPRLGADARDGTVEARGALAARRADRAAAARAGGAGRPLHGGARPSDAFDSRLGRRRADLRGGDRLLHGRLQVRPDSGQRGARRSPAARRARRRRRPAAVRRLDQCRPARRLAERVHGGPAPARAVRGLLRSHRGDVVRLQHPPRPAGHRCRAGHRSPGRAGRSLDAQERQHRPCAGTPRVPRGDADPGPRDRSVQRRAGGDRLDRLPGGAAVGVAPDGVPRPPPGGAAPRR
ncbi:MAG: Ribonuclease J (endonuclease and 5' exonuclease), partial [uncultured Solirubrobacteraceae bacterium]